MNKYELALVVSAKVEDEVRDAVVEKAKGYITRYNGTITEVEEWGKKKLAYEFRKCMKASTISFSLEADTQCPAEVERHVRSHGQCIKISRCPQRRIVFWKWIFRKHH